MKKGYVFITLFALFIASSQNFKYFFYSNKEHLPASDTLWIKVIVLFLTVWIPGLSLARWYYKNKI